MTKKNNAKITDTQERDYFFDINNPQEHNITFESAIETIKKFKPYYFCISHEIGLKEKTPHFHIYFRCKSPVRFSTWQKRFPNAHKEDIKGNPCQIRDYTLKINKYANDPKADTSIKTFEWGEIPISVKEKHMHEKEKLLEDIKAGKTNIEIIEENPAFAFRLREIDTIRNNYLREKNSKSFRSIKTYFFYGETATGKSTWVYDNFPPQEIFRIYNYHNLNAVWDGYNGEKVVFMDELTDIYPMELLLVITDKFPLTSGLNNRYNNVIPNFDVLIVATNTRYENMYTYERFNNMARWRAFDRRWENIWEFKKNAKNEYEIIKHRETKYEEKNKK